MSAAPGGGRPDVLARRPQAVALVAQLADPDRGWDAIVIGCTSGHSTRTSTRRWRRCPGTTASGCGCRKPAGGSTGTPHFRRPEFRSERNLWTTEIIPVLSIGAIGAVLWLLWANLHTIGGSIIWVDIIPWFCLGWLALGVVLALVLRRGSPEKYKVLGRMVNAGLD